MTLRDLTDRDRQLAEYALSYLMASYDGDVAAELAHLLDADEGGDTHNRVGGMLEEARSKFSGEPQTTTEWECDAAAGNGNGIFDQAYSFAEDWEGGGGCMTGTPDEIGQEIAKLLKALTTDDMTHMTHETGDFYLSFTIRPKEVGQ